MTALPPILGHSAPMRTLWDALAADRLHHALLFEGPDGVGRHLVARRLAMAANCEADGERPCGVCPTCHRIGLGNHPDVIEVGPDADSASGTIPVAKIREVIRAAGLHRYAAPHRFIVIDPAEALPAPAANALLKTLEEPNTNTHFVLIARHGAALLPTIVSRCQRHRFAPVPDDVVAAWLGERGVTNADEVAALAEGCPGRALAWADGLADERRTLRDELIEALGGDLEAVFTFSERLTEGGKAKSRGGVGLTLDVLDDLLRDAVVVAVAPDGRLRNPDLPATVAAWSAALWPGGVTACASAVADARAQLARNVAGRTVFDALLTRLATELGSARRARG